MATTTLAPDATLESSAYVKRVSYGTPPGRPVGNQTFAATFHLSGESSPTHRPTGRIDLYEDGTLKATGAEQDVTSTSGTTITQAFDLTSISLSDPSGAGVEARAVGEESNTWITYSGGEHPLPYFHSNSAPVDSVGNWSVNYLDFVSQTRTLKWDLPAQLGRSVDLLWDLRSAVSASLLRLKWDLLSGTPVNAAARTLKWDVRVPLSGDRLRLRWDIDPFGRPVVGEAAEELYAAMGCFTVGDEDHAWHLLKFCDALATVMLERVHSLVAAVSGRPPWQIAMDPETAPDFALAWLAQFVGAELEAAMSDSEQRDAIEVPQGWRRGTPESMREIARRTLTGTKSVNLIERDGDPYDLTVHVLSSEQTLMPTETARLIRKGKPIGLVLTYSATGGETWTQFDTATSSWDDAAEKFPTWYDVQFAAP